MATNTIREQIILAIISKLADIKTTNGYNTNVGTYINRAETQPNWDNTPFVTVFPRPETVTQINNAAMNAMTVELLAVAAFGTTNPSIVAELLLGDLIECMAGIEWTVAFTSGGPTVPVVGNTLTGAISEATAYLSTISAITGSWAGGDAAGVFTLRRMTGIFQAENLNIGASLNVATIAGALTGSGPRVTTTGSLAGRVQYVSGGPSEYPGNDETHVGVQATFAIDYETVSGDPYHQP